MQLAIDGKTGDLILTEGGVTRVSEGRFVVQQCQSKLRTFLGEWALDPLLGLVALSDFEKQYSLFDLEMRARKIILATQGVLRIDLMDASINKIDRKVLLKFEATTIYGGIDLTIPWDI